MNDTLKAITVNGVSKVYHVYDNPRERLKELLSLTKKKYCREFNALDGITFDVEHGETVGLIGRNGSGKSTLLQVICGILKPTTGTVETAGRISALLELGTGFNPEFTGRENVYLNGALMGFAKEEIDARYEDILGFADIGSFINQPVKTYSSGMYVRLAFACAVNVDPEILIVDEALSVGDVFFQQKCFRKIAEFREREKTILLVSHDLDTVQKNCGRAVFLDNGRLIKTGKSRDVINHYLETTLMKGEPARHETGEAVFKTDRKLGSHKGGSDIEDRCKQKPSYNINEFRYGNLNAVIVDFAMLDEKSREITSVFSGETLNFRFEVEFRESVEFPIYGFIVKTKDGVMVYGANTWHMGIEVEPKGRGDRVLIEYSQKINLSSGDFFISAGVAKLSGDDVVPLDRRYDFAFLKVMPVDKSFGLTNLFSDIKVKDLKPLQCS